MREMMKQRISSYSMKVRLYPSVQQREMIDQILRALHVAYNITFHYVFLKDPRVCTEIREDGKQWPDFRKMANKKWLDFLRKENPVVNMAPAAALSTNFGLFLTDAKRAWETGMRKMPIDPERRREFHFYNAAKPRRSFLVQMESRKLMPSPENGKVAWIHVQKVGRIKARGFNTCLCFGQDGMHTYAEAMKAGELPDKLTVRVSKDRCGDYYASITFSADDKNARALYLEAPAAKEKTPLGVDVGIKELAVLSDGQKIENKRFLKQKQPVLSRLNRKLSRRWGPANIAYRDYNKAIRQENRNMAEQERKPLAQPSQRYLKSQWKKAVLERKVARRRNTYYHQQSAVLVRQSSMIATETLLVKNMKRNHKLAHALTDAALSEFLTMVRYKTERYQIPICCIGTFEPSSQLCSQCGEKNPRVKNLSVRFWKCPRCGVRHDRDINAARNILQIAIRGGGVEDQPASVAKLEEPKRTLPPRRRGAVLPDRPELVVVFSKELTRVNDPRYVIKDTLTGRIVDDAQGVGYRSISNACNCYKAKLRWTKKECAAGA